MKNEQDSVAIRVTRTGERMLSETKRSAQYFYLICFGYFKVEEFQKGNSGQLPTACGVNVAELQPIGAHLTTTTANKSASYNNCSPIRVKPIKQKHAKSEPIRRLDVNTAANKKVCSIQNCIPLNIAANKNAEYTTLYCSQSDVSMNTLQPIRTQDTIL